MRVSAVISYIVAAAVTAPTARGSAGDMNYDYRRCLRHCQKNCNPEDIPALRQYLLWNCEGECQYDCMHEVARWVQEEYAVTWKFYGHWPYLRIWGLQEPASVAFSLGNMLPHIHNLLYNREKFCQPGVRFGHHILMYSVVALLAWAASAVFHARKIDPFISCDYAFAFLFISYGLWIAVSRLWWEIRGDRDRWTKTVFDVCCAGRVVYQVIYTLNGTIPFQDHMNLSIGLSVLHAVSWLLFICFSNSRSKLFCLLCQAWFGAASLLELYDFPPYMGILDAHALWHAATIPLGFLWFRFWIQDAEY
ncbi:unnamed protein product, partial [Ectocarpus fasciculatus]